MNQDQIAKLRKEYQLMILDEGSCEQDPFNQFGQWLDQAIQSALVEPNAMALATVSGGGEPSVRMVLLKRWSVIGLDFFTNCNSRKGEEISSNSNVSLLFYWGQLERQVRIYGTAEKLPREDVVEYFSHRPRNSQISALISNQSQIINSRDDLEQAHIKAQEQFKDKVPCPEHWGGYRVIPSSFEFWQGRENRLHDRILYKRSAQGWSLMRLAP